jgi:DNA-binding MarR family transcriptional regulator
MRWKRVYTHIMTRPPTDQTDHGRAARLMAEECLCFRARRTSRALTRLYDEALRPLGIQASQLSVLNAVALIGDREAAMGTLADILVMDRTTLSRNLRPLEQAGLIRIDPSPVDARARLVRLTAAGERAVAEALPLWTRANAQVVAALGAGAAAALRGQFDAAVAAASGALR